MDNKIVYKEVLHTIMTTDEIDKIISQTKGRFAKRNLQEIKDSYLKCIAPTYLNAPVWLTLPYLDNKLLLKNIIAFMVLTQEPKSEKVECDD